MLKSYIEIVTPQKAAEYLKRNVNNRPLRSRHIDELMRDMKAGKWMLTHQGIAFDTDGNLIDGQHRLTACVLSNVSFQTMVTIDLPEEAARNMDTGSARSYRDSLRYTGGSEDLVRRNNGAQSAVRSLVQLGYDRSYKLTNSEMDGLFDELKPQLETLYNAALTKEKRYTAPIHAAMLAALLNGETSEDLTSFFTVLSICRTDKSEGKNVQAPFALAHAIITENERRGRTDRERLYNIAQSAIWKYIHEKGAVKILSPTKTLRYPVDDILRNHLRGEKKDA